MAYVVTVPGGNGVTIAIPFTDGDNAMLATALLENLYLTPPAQQHIVDSSGGLGNGAAIPGDQNVLIADTGGNVAAPVGYQYLIDDYKLYPSDPYPITAFVARGTLDGSSIDSEATFLQFAAGTGAVNIVAGGDYRMTTLPNGGGGGTVDLDGAGTEILQLSSGSWSVTTGIGSAAAITLGNGSSTVHVEGSGTVTGGSGPDNILLDGGHDRVYGGSGTDTITAGGSDDTIYAGSGRESVFATSAGTFLVGGGAEVLYVDLAGGGTVIGDTSGLVVFGRDGAGSVYEVGTNYFYYTNEGGSDTIEAAAGDGRPIIFGGADGTVQINSAIFYTFVAAGPGNETFDASRSTNTIVLFAGTGSTDLIGAANNNNFYGANTGKATFSGGIGNVYEFTDGFAGGTDVITHFGQYDGLYLYNYGTSPQSGIASEVVNNGSLDITLTDGTLIIIDNVTNAAAIQGQIHHQ